MHLVQVGSGVLVVNGALFTPDGGPTVNNIVILFPQNMPAGNLNDFYNQTMSAVGGSGTYVAWFVASGSLPTGVSIDNGGNVTGTCTQAGTFTSTIQVNDNAGGYGQGVFTCIVA